MEFKIPFASRSIEYTAKEIDIILNIAKKANPLTMGANLLDFESKFRDFANVDYAFAVNSATSALELVAQLCNFKNNDEIIIPSHTYTSSCYPFIKAGAKIKWADIDLDTRVISDDSIAQNLTKNTRAIIVPHLYGFFKDIKKLLEIAKQNNLIVIEDAAQAIGSRIDDLHSGSQGDFGIFSFHSHKNITTLGEGGMIVVKDAQISNEVPKLRHNGHCKFNFNRKNFWEPAMGNLDISEINGDIFLPNTKRYYLEIWTLVILNYTIL